jgi:cell division protein FtsL
MAIEQGKTVQRRTVRKKFNRWQAFGLVVLIASVTIAYVDNVLRIDKTMNEIRLLEKRSRSSKSEIIRLEGRIIGLESPQRIIPIARDRMNMVLTNEKPEILK